jgi:hypothetical protein
MNWIIGSSPATLSLPIHCFIDSDLVYISFRDYSKELIGIVRFIPLKSNENKLLTCILDYEDAFVNVTDLLYEKNNDVWKH